MLDLSMIAWFDIRSEKMDKLICKFIEIILDKFMDDHLKWKRIVAVIILSSLILVIPILLMSRFKENSLSILCICLVIQSIFLLMYIHYMQKNWSTIDGVAKKYINGIISDVSVEYVEIKKRLNAGKDLLPINWIIISIAIGMFSNMSFGIPFVYELGVNVNYIYMFFGFQHWSLWQ